MSYLLSVGAFLAGAAFIFRSIAWAFGQAGLPYRVQERERTSDFEVRPNGADVKRVGVGGVRSTRKPAPTR